MTSRKRNELGSNNLVTHHWTGLPHPNPTTRRPYGFDPTSRNTHFAYKKTSYNSSSRPNDSKQGNLHSIKKRSRHKIKEEQEYSSANHDSKVVQKLGSIDRKNDEQYKPKTSRNQVIGGSNDMTNKKYSVDSAKVSKFEDEKWVTYSSSKRKQNEHCELHKFRKHQDNTDSESSLPNHNILGFCGKCIKYCMIISNIIIMIGGISILIFSCWTLYDDSYMQMLTGSNLYDNIVYIIIGSSGFTILVCILGCVGAAKEVKCMLIVYFIILCFLFVSMMIGGIGSYLFRDELHNSMEENMKSSMKMYWDSLSTAKAWDMIQQNLQCCGVYSEDDWPRGKVPNSCCKKENMRNEERKICAKYFTEGCLDVAHTYVQKHASMIGFFSIGLASIMIFGMALSCSLYKMIYNK